MLVVVLYHCYQIKKNFEKHLCEFNILFVRLTVRLAAEQYRNFRK